MRRLIRTIKESVLKKIKQGTNRTLILSVLFLLAFSGGIVAFATPPASPYAQNETLDPTCAPGDAYCYTEIPDASVTDTGLVNISAQSFAGIKTFTSTISGSSGSAYGHYIHPTVSQSGTADYIGLLVNVTEGATGSGTHYLADFQVDGASKLNIDSEGNVTAARSFAAGGGTIFPNVVGNFSGNTDSYLQVNIQNLNDGTSASSDFVATADDGDDSSNYVDLGINSSGYNSATLIYGGAHTAYLYSSDSDLVVGTAGATEVLKFFTGGDANANERIRVTSAGNVGIGDTTPTSLFTVGSGDKFQVDSNGNIVKLNNVTYSFPSSQGASATYLKNNGSGTLTWTALTTSTISEGSNLYWTNSRFDTRLDTATSAASLATVGTISSGTWNGTALTDAYVSDLITASNYVPLTQRGVANGVATLNSSGKVPASQLSALSLSTTYVVASEAAMLALSAAIPGDIAVRTDSSQTFILTDTDYSVLGNWVELLASSSVLSVNGLTGAVNITTSDVSEGTNLYYTADRVDTRISAQKAQPSGLATLDANGKVPTSQLAAMSANDTYVVASQVAMLALSATQGDLAVRSDESKTYILADTDPTVLANWVELLNSAAVVSVNGATGIVSLDTGDISENGSLYFTNARARTAISLGGSTPLTYNNGTGVLSIQEADTSTDGYITAVDWNTFNGKADVADLLTGETSGTGTETWLGVGAGASSGSTNETIFIGLDAGSGATGATGATFIGYNAGLGATDALNANFIGFEAGLNATDASEANFIGDGAGNAATDATHSNFMGYETGGSATNAAYSNFFGYQAGSGATNAKNSIFVGYQAGLNDTVNNTVSGHSILIGDLSSTGGFKNSIAIGTAATNTAINQLVVGGNGFAISNGFFGNGVTNASPSGFTLNATGGSGSNIAGSSLTLAGGKGTGNAAGGAIIFSTSDAEASGTTLQTLSEKMRITPAGFVGIGTNVPSYALDVAAPTQVSVEAPVFMLGTLDDLSSGGTYVGTSGNLFYVTIDGTGTPDTFSWSDDNGDCLGEFFVPITGAAQTLCNGVTITFGATTGHNNSEQWQILTTYSADTAINISDGSSYFIGDGLFGAQNSSVQNISFGPDSHSVNMSTATIAIGAFAGNQVGPGHNNVFVGVNAGYELNITGSLSGISKASGVTLIGADTGTYDVNTFDSIGLLTNATAIGYGAQVTSSNSLILGSALDVGLTGTETRVGIGTTAPDASAILDIVSTDMGVLLPRMDTTARDAVTPVQGLLIYNTDDGEFQYYVGHAWTAVGGGGGGGGDITVDGVYGNIYSAGTGGSLDGAGGGIDNILIGNTAGSTLSTGAHNIMIGGTAGFSVSSTGSNNVYIGYTSGQVSGTANANTFVGVASGTVNTTGASNTFIGYSAGNGNTTAANNTFVGASSGSVNSTGTGNTFMGRGSGRSNTTANNNTFLGYVAGDVNTTGTDNTFVGMNAGLVNTTGTGNTFLGKGAGVANTTASSNTFVGYSAGAANITGTSNSFFGYNAGAANTTGTINTFVGTEAGYVNTTGSSNTFIGRRAGAANTTAASNTFVGDAAGVGNTTGANGSFFGQGAGGNNTTGAENTFIGSSAGASNTTGADNTYLGMHAGYYQQAVNNQVAIGYEALRGSSTPGNNTGTDNLAIGYQAGRVNIAGSNNVFIGKSAGAANTQGSGNTFLGTTAGAANILSSNNTFLGYAAGVLNTGGSSNTFIGASAGQANTTAAGNTFIGVSAGFATDTGASNTFVGMNAGATNTGGTYNTFIGTYAGNSNLNATQNTFVGYQTGYSNTSGTENTALGLGAGYSNTTGTKNVFIGRSAGLYQDATDSQVALGYGALQGNVTVASNTGTGNTALGYKAGFANTSGSSGVFIGYQAGVANTTGGTNTFIGYESGKANSTGQKNTYVGEISGLAATGDSNAFFGYGAGVGITTGGNNTFLGTSADGSVNSITKSIAIGNGATATANDQFVVSSGSTTAMDVYFGNGVTAASPQGFYLNGTGGSGTNVAGGVVNIAAGKGTGNVTGAGISMYTSDAGASGTALQTLTEKFRINWDGNAYIMDHDNGNGAAGQILFVGRNTNATATGAGSVDFKKKSGTAGYVWQDNSGNMRIHTAAPTNANDTAGTVIGTQTSTRETKQNIEEYTDYTNALQLILDAPLHTFRYRNEVEGYGTDSPLAKVRIGYIADEVDPAFMWGNVIDQVSVNGILMAAVKQLDIKIANIADLTNESNSLVTALRNWLASATNGLVNIFSDKITTKELCVEDVCINKDQLRALIENAGQTLPPTGGDETPPTEEVPPSDTPPSDTPSDTPPAENPPSGTPPAEETPPSDETPPAGAPPAESPPAETPPSDTPPADAPTI